MSELCKGIDGRVNPFLEAPIEGEWTDLQPDETSLQVREHGRSVSVAAIIATGVNIDGRRETLELNFGLSEAAILWLGFLRGLENRGLKDIRPIISDAYEGLEAAVAQVFRATWKRCGVHFRRNALACVPKARHHMVAAAIRTVFMQAGHATVSKTWWQVADRLRVRIPKLAPMMDEADVSAHLAFSGRTGRNFIRPIRSILRQDQDEGLIEEVKRCADVVASSP